MFKFLLPQGGDRVACIIARCSVGLIKFDEQLNHDQKDSGLLLSPGLRFLAYDI